ncbi:hypothetical protein [Actinocorallia populi]|uniref:hypothetical protein n=1 Tax=Actinocorallia populi TaxID=2079200 RepID=UPI0018E55CB0|nr:hypothetical protein [Actinocorallia populi]
MNLKTSRGGPRVRTSARLAPLAVLLAAATACGGGGGDVGTVPVSSARTAPAASPPAPSAPGTPAAPERAPAVKPKVAPGVSARWVVYDRTTGRTVSRRAVHKTVRSASVVKLFIALDYLQRRGGKVAPADARRFRAMLRSSDDKAATHFWNLGGKGAIVKRMSKRIGLTDTAPPPAAQPGYWGYTAISAMDIAKTYRYLLEKASPSARSTIMGHLRKATKCGTDGFDQSFGLPRATRRAGAVKQGWSGFGLTPPYPCTSGARFVPAAAPDLGLGRPVLHTTGTVGGRDRWIVVVLTLNPAGASYRSSVERITALTRSLTKGL